MKMNRFIYVCVIITFLTFNSCSDSEDSCNFCINETARELVIDFVNSAVLHMNDEGAEAAFLDFNAPNPSSEFIDGELYIFVIDIQNIGIQNAVMVAHGANEALIGTEVYDLQGREGKYIVQDMAEAVDNPYQKGWSTYHWKNPKDMLVREKYSYVVKIKNYIVGAGIYDAESYGLQ